MSKSRFYRGGADNRGIEANVEIDFMRLLSSETLKMTLPPYQTGKQIILTWTIPDFVWNKESLALYFDGPAHDGLKQAKKDEIQNEELLRQKWKVIRVRYDGRKVSKEKLNRVLDWVHTALNDSRVCMWHYDLTAGDGRHLDFIRELEAQE